MLKNPSKKEIILPKKDKKETIFLTESEFPDYLRKSQLYINLFVKDDEEEDEEEKNKKSGVEIPKEFYKPSMFVKSLKDFAKLNRIINYFIAKLPVTMTDYFINNSSRIFQYYIDEEITVENKEISLETKDLFGKLISLQIKNIDQFCIVFRMIKLFNYEPSINYIKYGNSLKNNIKKSDIYLDGSTITPEVINNLLYNYDKSLSYLFYELYESNNLKITFKKLYTRLGDPKKIGIGLNIIKNDDFNIGNFKFNDEIDETLKIKLKIIRDSILIKYKSY